MDSGIFPFFVLLAGLIAYLAWRHEEKRKAAIRARCAERRWSYAPAANEWVGRLRGDFPLFGRGRSKRCRNVITVPEFGPGDREATLFDYTYVQGSGKNSTTYRYAVAHVPLPVLLPDLRLGGEGVFSRLASSVGFRDVEVESVDFNRRFRVAADDRTHAFDVLHPQMIAFLLAQPFDDWEVVRGRLLLHRRGHWQLHEYDAVLSAIAQFLTLVPDYVWRKHGATR